MVSALTTWGIALIGPLLADTSAQARAGAGYARADFTVDYDHKTVTCPQGKTSASWTPCTQRGNDPAIIAQAAATAGLLTGGRFNLGVGTGEVLNEHVTGAKWPAAEERQQMLEEAVTIIAELFTGEQLTYHGPQADLIKLYRDEGGGRPCRAASKAAGRRMPARRARPCTGCGRTAASRASLRSCSRCRGTSASSPSS